MGRNQYVLCLKFFNFVTEIHFEISLYTACPISNLIQTANQVRFLRQRSFRAPQAPEFSISLSVGVKAVAKRGHKVAARLHSDA